MSYTIVERGASNTEQYRVFFKNDKGEVISPLHDIPLYSSKAGGIVNMVVEVPRWTNAKMEINVKGKMNPIKQDIKKGKLRFVNNCFPHHGYIWNYGALPQTWEDPNHTDQYTKFKGDNDPLDVCEIGHKVGKRGSVIQVKVLGVLAMIDEGETDWKVIAIDVTDPLAASLNDINDVETHMPGFLAATREWFRIYKMPTGKPENKFAFDGEFKGKNFCKEILDLTHNQWQRLVSNKIADTGMALSNTTLDDSPFKIRKEDAAAEVNASPPFSEGPRIEAEVDKWHYVRL